MKHDVDVSVVECPGCGIEVYVGNPFDLGSGECDCGNHWYYDDGATVSVGSWPELHWSFNTDLMMSDD